MPEAPEVLRPAARPGAQRIVIIGAGFAGFFAARRLQRKLKPEQAEITLIADLDGLLYQPLLPDVAVGNLDPRTITVPLSTTLSRVHLVRGRATKVDATSRTVSVTTQAGTEKQIGYDRLLITAGSVTRVMDVPGLADHAVGFKTTAEAMYLRDFVLSRMQLANDEPDADARKGLLNFIVVGAGYAGTELVAQMARMTAHLAKRFPLLGRDDLHWMLLDTMPVVMPELGESLGKRALALLRKRGVDVRLKTSVAEINDKGAQLTDGSWIPGATVVWCAGVTPSPIVADTALEVARGRLLVDADMRVAGFTDIYAAGDAAAVPDISKPQGADGQWPVCPPTAQHAMRQGTAVARNIIADIRGKPLRPYKHRDLGLVVDLGGVSAVARPLGIPLSGVIAKLVTRGYHVFALPTMRRRLRALANWALAGRTPDDVSVGMLGMGPVLASAEHSTQAVHAIPKPSDTPTNG